MAYRLRIPVKNRPRKLKGTFGPGGGQEERMRRMQTLLTKLLREERIEGNYDQLHEARGYTERLIQEAIQHGPQHEPTMEVADFYMLEKDLVPKLFEVLAPRFHNYATCFTSLYRLPTEYPGPAFPVGMLELKGNPWPSMRGLERDTRGQLSNILLEEARKEWRNRKAELQLERQLETETGVAGDSARDSAGDSSGDSSRWQGEQGGDSR